MTLLNAFALAVAPVAAGEGHPLVEIFISACVDGKVSFEPGTVQEVEFKDLPPVVRRGYGERADSAYYEIKAPVPGYLLIMRGKEDKGFNEICAVHGPGLPYEQGYEQVMMATVGALPERETGPSLMLEFYNAEQGYVLNASRKIAGWGHLQIAHTGEAYKPVLEGHPAVSTRRLKSTAEKPTKEE